MRPGGPYRQLEQVDRRPAAREGHDTGTDRIVRTAVGSGLAVGLAAVGLGLGAGVAAAAEPPQFGPEWQSCVVHGPEGQGVVPGPGRPRRRGGLLGGLVGSPFG